MILKNVAKMLSRRFSSGTTSVVTKNRGTETKHQATEEAKQLTDEFNAILFFPIDRVIWLGVIISIGARTGEQFIIIPDIKDKDSKLSASLSKRQ
ncbi:hypothetical protein MKX01_012390 [Papaver californicum]|nr:hypothetical protein MKX01_012390 [Papaver californicum]